jgi:hypothetical protein
MVYADNFLQYVGSLGGPDEQLGVFIKKSNPSLMPLQKVTLPVEGRCRPGGGFA